MALLEKAEKAIKEHPEFEKRYEHLFGKNWRELLAATNDKGEVKTFDYLACADRKSAAYSHLKIQNEQEEKDLKDFSKDVKKIIEKRDNNVGNKE
jgi:hypothetical protein